MKTYFYLNENEGQEGPVYASELPKYGVTRNSMVWNEEMNEWQTAGSIPEIADIIKSPSKLEMMDEKMSKNQIFTFSNPYLKYLSKGEFFSLVYIIMAVLNLMIPFIILFQMIKLGFFKQAESNEISAFLLLWIVFVFTFWIGALLWWNRRKKVKSIGTPDFIALPIFSHIIQTFGEWIGTLIGIIGAFAGLLTAVFLGNDASIFSEFLGSEIVEFMQLGIKAVIAAPIIGLIIMILFRVVADILHKFAAIANNTKEIATNIKKII